MRLIDLSYVEPALNLALDEALLDAAEEGLSGETLRFWESPSPFVVLGTAQEIAKEAHEEHCAADSVPILRRGSAGGCVLQGPGSLNYALVMLPELRPEVQTLRGSYDYILGALGGAFARLGLEVTHAGTCDLAIDGQKVSGNAQKRRRRAFLHHGTLLYRADPAAMARYLLEPEDRPDYRGARTHGDFVGVLPLTPETIKAAVAAAFGALAPASAPTPWETAHAEALAAEKYRTDAWTRRR